MPKSHWSSIENQKQFATQLTKQMESLGIPFSSLTSSFIRLHGGSALLGRYKTIGNFLRALVPEHAHLADTISRGYGKKKTQVILTEIVRSLFRGHEVLEEYKHQDLLFKTGGKFARDYLGDSIAHRIYPSTYIS
jgi:hypothetical protein